MFIAVRTGLEPATPGVTGLYSNQLNYRTGLFPEFLKWRYTDSGRKGVAFFLKKQILHNINLTECVKIRVPSNRTFDCTIETIGTIENLCRKSPQA